MTLPSNVSVVTVTESYLTAAGAPESGTVAFTPSVRVTVGGTSITIAAVTGRVVNGALLASDGVSPLVLAATDDPDLTPSGWTYQVVEKFAARRRAYNIALPASPPTRVLHTLAPVDPVTPGAVRVLTVEGIGPDPSGNVDLPPSAGGVPSTRVIATTNGLAGGGDLSGDRTLSLTYGASAGTVCQGNDARLTNARTPVAHTHPISDVTGLSAGLAGKATKLVVRDGWVKTGDINPLPNTAGGWAILSGFELSVPAVAGDYLEVSVNAMRKDGSGNSWLDCAIVVGSSIVRYLASGDGTPGLEGDPGWYVPAGGIIGRGSPRGFTVASGDLDTGNVRVVIAVKSNGSGILYASTNYPFYWQVKNYGSVG